jgi:ankyrin repeat protein
MDQLTDEGMHEPLVQWALKAAAPKTGTPTVPTALAPCLDPLAVGPNGSTALVMVCTQGRLAEVHALVKAGLADVNREAWQFDDDQAGEHTGSLANTWKRRRTPLLAAAVGGHLQVVEALLDLDADIHRGKSDDGASPLFLASQGGHTAVAELLLARNGDPNQATADDFTTPLHM